MKTKRPHPDARRLRIGSPEERARAAGRMSELRWKGTTAEERSKFMTWVVSQGGGRPLDPDKARCPCGRMTLARAQARADKKGKSLGHFPECTFYRGKRYIAKHTRNRAKEKV